MHADLYVETTMLTVAPSGIWFYNYSCENVLLLILRTAASHYFQQSTGNRCLFVFVYSIFQFPILILVIIYWNSKQNLTCCTHVITIFSAKN